MRHLKSGRRLGVTTSHRKAMMRNMVTSLLENEQISCTTPRAKELRRCAEKIITLGKRGNLHARRQALQFVKSKKAMAALFGELAERYALRSGGYTRIIKLATRRLGDASDMALIQLVDGPKDPFLDKKTSKLQKSSVLKEVKKEITEEKKED